MWSLLPEIRAGRLGRDYFKSVSLRFILHGLFLMLATSFFFSSTSSINCAISPSDMDTSSLESESESEELDTQRYSKTNKFLRQNIQTLKGLWSCKIVMIAGIWIIITDFARIELQ